jgi:tetratricopeptide (TPR) repeat protein
VNRISSGRTADWKIGICITLAAACATPVRRVDVSTAAPITAHQIAEADWLAARGCYLCLKEAAVVYEELLEQADRAEGRAGAQGFSPGYITLATNALENHLMIALREVELRMPDSGAREAALGLQARVPASYALYFAALDALGPTEATGATRSGPYVTPATRQERMKLAAALETEWPASPMKSYFYLSAALSAAMVAELKPQVEAILNTHQYDLSLKYRMQAFLPTFSEEESRALIGEETGFGEVHFLLGQRAVLDARLEDAHRELTRARQLLPDSAAITLVLANVKMAYARYAEALELYQSVPSDADARLGRARALSYLRRHAEAIAMLDDLLQDLRNNPGEKHYWRAWNRLRIGETQAAYDDAIAALKGMRNNEVYRLAGIAAFGLSHLSEARGYFENALNINATDCDAERYLGQIDAAERSWRLAFGRFSTAVACYDQALARMSKELATHEQDISGLSNSLIAAIRAEIDEVRSLRAAASTNAAVTAKNAGI